MIYASLFSVYNAQQILAPALPALARQLSLSEVQLGAVVTMAALVVVLASPVCGYYSDAWGRKPVLVMALVIAGLGLLAFAIGVEYSGHSTPTVVFVLMLLTRGLLFGVALAAAAVAAQAFLTDVSTTQQERVNGMARIGAARGVALITGPAVGALLSTMGVAVPLYVAPLSVLAAAVLVGWRLPSPPPRTSRASRATMRMSDQRIWPFLVCGFGMFLALGMVQIATGFLIQDRLRLSTTAAVSRTGVALMVAGAMFLVAQAVVVPRLGWPPLRLLRAGIPAALVGMAGLAVAGSLPAILFALGLLGLGLGVAVPGYLAGPTLLVTADEQASLAGLMNATNAVTFVIGPVLGTSLYQSAPAAPYLAGSGLLAGLLLFVFLHPALRARND